MPFNLNPQNSAIEYTSGITDLRPLTADQTVTASTTLVAVPQLTFNLAKYQRVAFRADLFFTTVAAADFKYRLTVPASVTLYRACRQHIAPDALTTFVTAYDVANNGSTDYTVTCASGTEGYVTIQGIIHNGVNAGDFQVLFAQNTSDAGATILRAGSFLEVEAF